MPWCAFGWRLTKSHGGDQTRDRVENSTIAVNHLKISAGDTRNMNESINRLVIGAAFSSHITRCVKRSWRATKVLVDEPVSWTGASTFPSVNNTWDRSIKGASQGCWSWLATTATLRAHLSQGVGRVAFVRQEHCCSSSRTLAGPITCWTTCLAASTVSVLNKEHSSPPCTAVVADYLYYLPCKCVN